MGGLVSKRGLQPVSERPLIILAGVATVLLLAAFWTELTDLFKPAPVFVDLPELERQFDRDPHGAIAFWSGKPMLLDATVSSQNGDTLHLETIYFQTVPAELNHEVYLQAGQRVRLHCRDVALYGILSDKPHLYGCNVAD